MLDGSKNQYIFKQYRHYIYLCCSCSLDPFWCCCFCWWASSNKYVQHCPLPDLDKNSMLIYFSLFNWISLFNRIYLNFNWITLYLLRFTESFTEFHWTHTQEKFSKIQWNKNKNYIARVQKLGVTRLKLLRNGLFNYRIVDHPVYHMILEKKFPWLDILVYCPRRKERGFFCIK